MKPSERQIYVDLRQCLLLVESENGQLVDCLRKDTIKPEPIKSTNEIEVVNAPGQEDRARKEYIIVSKHMTAFDAYKSKEYIIPASIITPGEFGLSLEQMTNAFETKAMAVFEEYEQTFDEIYAQCQKSA